ncbi:Glycosyltransferase involved in cell wall bisynthesis [Salinimicrobium sediminis]|uniref:Glycosyltransferase involved in cell wall bisynthesis n=1 Tax=Salinimicrobium sediminis TaxID=1343891 RepID=A0A285WZQ2_9FLAO|nr:glycosyltransferase family 4 protein [Salinimicrobium sediminis]SOC78567.1 Glycosyltransferase involved in cell wall bisynthesis [Salinimicrobium sediminis]
MRISILHPFTPEVVGLNEKNLPTIHSQPHLKALQILSKERNFECSMEYFTSRSRAYSLKIEDVIYRFYPVTYKWSGDHKKWKKQSSTSCLRYYNKNTPDVTIINMSGHSSPFSYELSKIIKSRDKVYIAMLGGQHYSDNERNRDYYKNAHHILVHTLLQKREMLKLDLFKDVDIHIFPLGVDSSVFTPVEKCNKSPYLLYVGRILELKRTHFALEALKKLVENGFLNAQLDIIGPVSSKVYFVQLKELVLKLQLEKNVHFLGEMEHLELVSHYQGADLLMLPSKSESFGMVMVEAMACGTPVAAMSSSGGPGEIIEHGQDGIIASPENYGEEILQYFKKKEKQIYLSKRAREKVERSFSIQATYKALENSVDSVYHTKA